MPRSHATRHATQSKKHPSRRRKLNKNLRWLWLLPVAAVIALILFMTLGEEEVKEQEITVAEAYANYQAGVFLLDVRTQEEWDEKHVPGSALIPLVELKDRLGEIPSSEEVMVICRSGNRSREAIKTLLAAGFTQVSSVTGGITAWVEAGYPVEP